MFKISNILYYFIIIIILKLKIVEIKSYTIIYKRIYIYFINNKNNLKKKYIFKLNKVVEINKNINF